MKTLTIGIEVRELWYTPQDGGYGRYYIKFSIDGFTCEHKPFTYEIYYTVATDGDNGTIEIHDFDQQKQSDYDDFPVFDFETLPCYAQEKIYSVFGKNALEYATVYNKPRADGLVD